MIKAHAVRLFGMALALAGLVALLYFAALLTWPRAIGFVPALNAGFAPYLAALGAILMAAGILIAIRQTARLRALKKRREDGLRRVGQYRADAAREQLHESRLEPFIGPGTVAGRETDRRVA